MVTVSKGAGADDQLVIFTRIDIVQYNTHVHYMLTVHRIMSASGVLCNSLHVCPVCSHTGGVHTYS